MPVHSYRGVDDSDALRQPMLCYRREWRDVKVPGSKETEKRLSTCGGSLMLMVVESDSERLSYILVCDACTRRIMEIDGFPIEKYLDTVSDDPIRDSGMISERGYTGYLAPGYLRWCGVPGKALERARMGFPLYCWSVKE